MFEPISIGHVFHPCRNLSGSHSYPRIWLLRGMRSLHCQHWRFDELHDLIKENTAPNISVLHAVETIVAAGNETIDLPRVSHFVMLTPVPGKLKLGLLGGAEFAKTIEIDNEWHVSTVFPEKSKTMSLKKTPKHMMTCSLPYLFAWEMSFCPSCINNNWRSLDFSKTNQRLL